VPDKKLADRLQSHRDKFDRRKQEGGIDYSPWFLHLVVFPSLMDIARELDRVTARLDDMEAKRAKGGSGV